MSRPGASTQAHPPLHTHVCTCCCSVPKLWLTLCDPVECSTPGFPALHQLLEFAQTQVHWVSDAIQPPHPQSSLLLLTLIFPSIRVFSNESVLHNTWPEYWSFIFSISPSSEHPGLISFRMDRISLQSKGLFKSLLQHHSSKASILRHSAFFIVQFSHVKLCVCYVFWIYIFMYNFLKF